MTTVQLSKAQANLQIILLDKQANLTSSEELYIRMQKLGLPKEVTSRLHSMLQTVKEIAGKAIQLGKIIVLNILEFVRANPSLLKKLGIKVLLSAAITSLLSAVPYIGPLLAPLSKFIGASIASSDASSEDGFNQVLSEDNIGLFEVTQNFFKLLIKTLNSVVDQQPILIPA